jgi:hypothetical protein
MEWRTHKQTLDEVLGVVREPSWELVVQRDDFLEHEVFRPGLKGGSTGYDLVEDATEAPVVGSSDVVLARRRRRGGGGTHAWEDSFFSERISGETYSGVPTKDLLRARGAGAMG